MGVLSKSLSVLHMFPESMLGKKTQFEVIGCTKFPVRKYNLVIFTTYSRVLAYLDLKRNILKLFLRSFKLSTQCTNKLA